MADHNLSFAQTINSFACMRRPQFTIRQEPIHWNGHPPKEMFA
jgi:hypothetical protein